MKPLIFYTIFHKNIFEENTIDFTKEEKQEMFCWIGVNEKIPKYIPESLKSYNIIYEYEMSVYSPLYQMCHFYQNSVFFHLYKNQYLLKSKYVGFGQYDMTYNAASFRKIYEIIQNDTNNADILFPAFIYVFEHLFGGLKEEWWIEYFLEPYNEFYGTTHTLEKLRQIPLFLYHTFIIPTWYFIHIMRFIENTLPNILKGLNWKTYGFAGTMERIFSLCLSCGLLEGKLKNVYPIEGITHNLDQHTGDIERGISPGSSQPQGT
jgi:hypothetical protein